MLPAFCLFEWIILPLICGGLEVGAFTGSFCSGNKKTSSSEALNKNPDWRGFLPGGGFSFRRLECWKLACLWGLA